MSALRVFTLGLLVSCRPSLAVDVVDQSRTSLAAMGLGHAVSTSEDAKLRRELIEYLTSNLEESLCLPRRDSDEVERPSQVFFIAPGYVDTPPNLGLVRVNSVKELEARSRADCTMRSYLHLAEDLSVTTQGDRRVGTVACLLRRTLNGVPTRRLPVSYRTFYAVQRDNRLVIHRGPSDHPDHGSFDELVESRRRKCAQGPHR